MKGLSRVGGILTALVMAGTAVAQDGRFQRVDFQVTGTITNVVSEDFNGDGLIDLVAVHADESKNPVGRYLTLYPQTKGKGFDPKVKIEYTFPASVAAVDLGDVTSDPGDELVFITEKGVFSAPILAERIGPMSELFEVQSVVAIAYTKDVPYFNFVRDYTGDGRDDILVQGFYDTTLARQGEGYKFTRQTINLRPTMDVDAFDMSEIMSGQEQPILRVSYRAPQIFVLDHNADGKPDLIANFRDEAQIYDQTPTGFTPNFVKKFDLRLYKEKKQGRRGNPPPNVNYSDLDGDGKVDILVSQVNGEITDMKSRAVLYWGKSRNIEAGKPDLEFKTASPVLGRIIVQDVNKDGRPDLILPTYALNAWSVGKALLTGDVNVEWAYFMQRPDKSYATTPDRVTSTGLKFNLSKLRLESGLPNIMGDFNGDGFYDHVYGTEENVLLVTLLDQNGNNLGIEERIEVPVSMINRAVDLNQDGRSDILVIYRDEQTKYANTFRVLINVGPWAP